MKSPCSQRGKKPSFLLRMKIYATDLWHSCQNLRQAVLALGQWGFQPSVLVCAVLDPGQLDPALIGVEEGGLVVVHID